MMRIYISHPITLGDGCDNFYDCCKVQQLLMEAGYAVLNPGLSMMHPNGKNIPWQRWIDSDLKWVEVADMVVRLPGESKGADVECEHARKCGIPVYSPYLFPCLRELFPEPPQPHFMVKAA